MKPLIDAMPMLKDDRHFSVLETLMPEEYADTLRVARKLALQDHRSCPFCENEVELLGHEWTNQEGLISFERTPVDMSRIFDDTIGDSRWVNSRDRGSQIRFKPSSYDKLGFEKKGQQYHVLVHEFYCPACDVTLTRPMTRGTP